MDTYQPATEPQIKFLKNLLSEREGADEAKKVLAEIAEWTEDNGCLITKRAASGFIDRLIKTPKVVAPRPVRTAPVVEVSEGVYFKDLGDTQAIVKVQRAVHGSGNLYAKQLNLTTGQFEYVAGLIRKLEGFELLTYAKALEFGQLYGRCMVCGRTLTNESSIEAGIGPVCGSRLADYVSPAQAKRNLKAAQSNLAAEAAEALAEDAYWDARMQEKERAEDIAVAEYKMRRDEALFATPVTEVVDLDTVFSAPRSAPVEEKPVDTLADALRIASAAVSPGDLPVELLRLAGIR